MEKSMLIIQRIRIGEGRGGQTTGRTRKRRENRKRKDGRGDIGWSSNCEIL
jgi:hypothetical protein